MRCEIRALCVAWYKFWFPASGEDSEEYDNMPMLEEHMDMPMPSFVQLSCRPVLMPVLISDSDSDSDSDSVEAEPEPELVRTVRFKLSGKSGKEYKLLCDSACLFAGDGAHLRYQMMGPRRQQ